MVRAPFLNKDKCHSRDPGPREASFNAHLRREPWAPALHAGIVSSSQKARKVAAGMPSRRVHGNNARKARAVLLQGLEERRFAGTDQEGLPEEGVRAKAPKMARPPGWRENRTGFLAREQDMSHHTEPISSPSTKTALPPGPQHTVSQNPAGSVSVQREASSPNSTVATQVVARSHLCDAETCYWAFSSPSSTRPPPAETTFAFWTALSVRSHHTLFSEGT